MRITFICGSLNPGQDGVGDYTRRLATQLCENGHECLLVSINDVTNAEESSDHLTVLRFSDLLNHSAQADSAIQQIKNWNPDWISLQFVCFSFHPKGFIHQVSPFIQSCREGTGLHIMFHELWVGEQPSLPLKHKVMGLIQRHLMLKALDRWKADVLHTSNALYQFILQQHGYAASILPLFSNIPLSEPSHGQSKENRNERTLLLPFSQRHDWNVTETLKQLETLSVKANVSLRLIQIGQLRSGDQHWPQIQAFSEAHNWTCEVLGPQDEAALSSHMHRADIGISSAHIALAGKSGAVAAMMEHGLPVICTITEAISKRFHPKPNGSEALYSFFDPEQRLIELFRNPHRNPPAPLLPTAAKQFIEDLTQSR